MVVLRCSCAPITTLITKQLKSVSTSSRCSFPGLVRTVSTFHTMKRRKRREHLGIVSNYQTALLVRNASCNGLTILAICGANVRTVLKLLVVENLKPLETVLISVFSRIRERFHLFLSTMITRSCFTSKTFVHQPLIMSIHWL